MANKKKKNEEVEIGAIETVKTESTSNFIEDNQSKILGVLAVLVLLVGAYMAYKYLVKAPKEKEASVQLYKAEAQFAIDSFALALENPGGGFEGFLEIIENYSGTSAANTSKYYAGISYLNMGRFDDAIEYLEGFSPSDLVTPIMKAGALGDAYSENGDMDKAASLYKKASSYDNELLAPYYLNKLALLAQSKNDNAAAIAAYETIIEKYPNSTEAKDAEKYLLKLK